MDDVEWPEFAQGAPQPNGRNDVMHANAAIHRQQPHLQPRGESMDGVGEGDLGPDRGINQRYVMTGRDLVAEKLHDDPAASSAGGFDDMTDPHPASD
jgi:hypothetical protein